MLTGYEHIYAYVYDMHICMIYYKLHVRIYNYIITVNAQVYVCVCVSAGAMCMRRSACICIWFCNAAQALAPSSPLETVLLRGVLTNSWMPGYTHFHPTSSENSAAAFAKDLILKLAKWHRHRILEDNIAPSKKM